MKGRILIACHKNSSYVKSNIMKPIQVGAVNKKHLEGMLHDDDGINISGENPKYCEITAQYYAWKNLTDFDYIGLFHYRRYLSFNDTKKFDVDIWQNVSEGVMDDSVVEKYHLDDTTINLFAEKYDVILPEIKDIRKMPSMGNNMREQYLGSGYLHECDYNTMMTVLNEKYPEFTKYALEYENGHTTYLNNMFIMKREIFNAYSAWLFDILEECDKRIDYSDYSIEAIRTLGHLAERLLNIYCLYLKSQNKYKFKELQTVAFLNTEVEKEITPAYSVNNVAIALSANDFYVPYVSALLISLRENCTLNNNYDIIIMHRDISPDSQKKLSSVFNAYHNVTVRFLNINKYTSKFKNLYLRGHFAVETYFRLLMPEILPNYEKILYLDSDIIVNADVADLYNENIEGYLLAACHDADTAGLYNGYEPNKKDYMDHILKIKKPYEYFQAGVILFNLNEFRKTYTVEEMLKFAASYQWQLLDQDVLNYLAQGRTKIVDMSWNVMTDWRGIRIRDIISRAPKYLYDEYMHAHANPKILHYAGPDKPWHQPYSDYADLFWKYARTSVYYEVLIQRIAIQEANAMQNKKQGKLAVFRPAVNRLMPYGTRRRKGLDHIYSKMFNKW